MTWWRKRTSERDQLTRTVVGITVKTELELALHEMRRAFEQMERTIRALAMEEEQGERGN